MSLHTIEKYGHLCALLDDGVGARPEILAAAGLDEAGWQRLRAECLLLLASKQAPATAIAFGRAYASARHQLAAPKVAATPQEVPPTSVTSDGDGPSAEPRVLDADRTTDQAFPLAGPALPFRPAVSLTPMQARTPHVLYMPPRGTVHAADVTLDASPAPASPVLPFFAPPAPERRRRLMHFEPSTGRRLSPPVWVDEPGLPEPTAR